MDTREQTVQVAREKGMKAPIWNTDTPMWQCWHDRFLLAFSTGKPEHIAEADRYSGHR